MKKDSLNSSICYKGNVTISLMKNGRRVRTIHRNNAGNEPLFTFLVNCLANNYDGNGAPRFLMGFYKNENTETKVFDAPIPVYYVEANPTDQKTTFKFIIPSGYIKIGDNESLNVLKIYSTNNNPSNAGNLNKFSAEIELGNNAIEKDDLGSGVNIIILWEMIFSNKPKPSEQ